MENEEEEKLPVSSSVVAIKWFGVRRYDDEGAEAHSEFSSSSGSILCELEESEGGVDLCTKDLVFTVDVAALFYPATEPSTSPSPESTWSPYTETKSRCEIIDI